MSDLKIPSKRRALGYIVGQMLAFYPRLLSQTLPVLPYLADVALHAQDRLTNPFLIEPLGCLFGVPGLGWLRVSLARDVPAWLRSFFRKQGLMRLAFSPLYWAVYAFLLYMLRQAAGSEGGLSIPLWAFWAVVVAITGLASGLWSTAELIAMVQFPHPTSDPNPALRQAFSVLQTPPLFLQARGQHPETAYRIALATIRSLAPYAGQFDPSPLEELLHCPDRALCLAAMDTLGSIVYCHSTRVRCALLRKQELKMFPSWLSRLAPGRALLALLDGKLPPAFSLLYREGGQGDEGEQGGCHQTDDQDIRPQPADLACPHVCPPVQARMTRL